MLKIVVAVFLLLLSLLTVFRAPTNFLWRVSVAITEFPYIFIFASLIICLASFWSVKYKYVLMLISVVSFLLYSLPIVKAYATGKNVTSDFSKVFSFVSKENQLEEPFSFIKMFSGIGIEKQTPNVLLYKKVPGRDLNIDFYSAGTKKLPCVIVIHGGSWSEGDSKQLPDLNSYLANRGYHVAAINYRLAPTHKSPAPIEDTKDAIKYLCENSEKLNIDTNNFVLLGRSAGGQIALVSAYTFKDPKIKGVISFYAPADMIWGGKIKVGKWVLNTEKVFNEYLGGNIDEVPEKFKEASSCEFVDKNSTPTLLIHGKIDAMVAHEHANRLSKKLNENNIKHYFLDLPCSTHGCDFNINGPSGQLSTFTVERFLNSVTSQ